MLCQVWKCAFICFVNSEIINQIVMELVVIEKNAYLQLKLQIESLSLSLIHISEPTRLLSISYAVFCLKKKFF